MSGVAQAGVVRLLLELGEKAAGKCVADEESNDSEVFGVLRHGFM